MKKRVVTSFIFAIMLVVSSLTGGFSMFAHGYVMYPESRAYLGSLGINKNVGQAQYEPQSIEAPKGFPEGGPADGHIAGGGKYPELDEQTEDRWVKVDVPTGDIDFTWNLTAPHKTSSWKYYITKKGWNPNAALSRDQLELFQEIEADGTAPQRQVTQTITIPDDREGYYVILAIWNIADTANAFYQVIDANIVKGDSTPDTEAPSQPQNVVASKVTAHAVSIAWEASTDNVGVKNYEIARDGQMLGTTSELTYEDKTVTAGTTYAYTVTAIDRSGNKSTASETLTVIVPETDPVDTEKPSTPHGVSVHHKTDSEIMLHWHESTDNVGVAGYNIYRDGVKVGTTDGTMFTDKNLQADTTYTYTIEAFDFAGNVSDLSEAFVTKTEEGTPAVEGEWDANTVYNSGDVVTYNGNTYRANWWTRGDNPETSNAWILISGGSQIWSAEKAYRKGDKVEYNGKTYQAKWWIQGEKPDASTAWELVE